MPKIVITPALVGDAVTFWNAPLVTMAGLISSEVAAPAASAVTTNWARVAVVMRDCGLTAKHPANVTLVPRVTVPFSAATVIVEPLWFAPFTVLVATTAVPFV